MYGRKRFGRKRFGKRRSRYSRKRFGKFSRYRRPVRRFARKITTSKERNLQVSDRQLVKLSKTFNLTVSVNIGNTFGVMTVPGNYLNVPGGTPIDKLPAGTEQWASFYSSARVLGSRIKVISYNVVSGIPFTLSVTPVLKSQAADLNPDQVYDATLSKYRVITVNPDMQVISNYVSSKKMFGQPVTYEDDYQMNFGYGNTPPYPFQGIANYPPEESSFVWAIGTELTAPAGGVQVTSFKVTVEYYCRFEDKVQTQAFEPTI